ncbi:MAG TPA: CDP-diacylglycerol diphosphatase [Elusimicrobiota bacterium]|nr:CDP-diacylglycerol diphosphatase [Elusimicrobiota bacterium]
MAGKSAVRAAFWTLAAATALATFPAAANAEKTTGRAEVSHRGILYAIVTECLDAPSKAGLAGYCAKCPAPLENFLGRCDPHFSAWEDPVAVCRKTARVWAKTPRFAAIRDIKMCGCRDKNFIHGLALPRAKVTGVEDVRRLPKGIWRFAWNAAVRRIGDENSVALVVNPPGRRTQDQLHIHLVRLAPGARKRLEDFDPEHLDNLDDVWIAVEENAENKKIAFDAYGLAIIRDLKRGYWFAVIPESAGSPEALFSQYDCSK